MGVFDRQQKSAKRLIDKYGELITIKRLAYSISNPDKPWELTEIPATQATLKMVFLAPGNSGATMLGRELYQYLSGTQNVTGELRGLASNEFVFKPNDLIIRNSGELKIKAIDPLKPNEQLIMQTIEFVL